MQSVIYGGIFATGIWLIINFGDSIRWLVTSSILSVYPRGSWLRSMVVSMVMLRNTMLRELASLRREAFVCCGSGMMMCCCVLKMCWKLSGSTWLRAKAQATPPQPSPTVAGEGANHREERITARDSPLPCLQGRVRVGCERSEPCSPNISATYTPSPATHCHHPGETTPAHAPAAFHWRIAWRKPRSQTDPAAAFCRPIR